LKLGNCDVGFALSTSKEQVRPNYDIQDLKYRAAAHQLAAIQRPCGSELLENSFKFFTLIDVSLPSIKNAYTLIINKIEIDFGKF